MCGTESDGGQSFAFASSDIEGVVTIDGDNFTNVKAGWALLDPTSTDSNGNYVLNELPDDYEFPTFSNLSIAYGDDEETTDAELEFYNTVYNGLFVSAE